MKKNLLLISILASLSLNGLAQAKFTDIAKDNSIFQTVHARGVSIIDYDNDGDDDIFVAAEPSKLYRNDGNFVFADVTAESGILVNAKLSVWFDANDDGWLDVIAASWNTTKFYLSNGDGTFVEGGAFDVLKRQSLLVGDLNGDQWLDIYSANFRQPNRLLFNVGEGSFTPGATGTEISASSMGGLLVDYDDDGDLDIYVVFDTNEPNVLYENSGNGSFVEKASQYGLDTRSNAMGVDVADFNLDGEPDFYITNLYANYLLISDANGEAVNMAETTSTDDEGMGWGVFCFDYNNDMYADIYCVNEFNYNQHANILYRNNGDLTLTNVAVGTSIAVEGAGYGGAYGDFDHDGRLDFVVANFNEVGVKVFRNDEDVSGNWVQLNLVGSTSNKFAVGAAVRVMVNGVELLDEVNVGSGYASQNALTLHFGLGENSLVDQITIRWPDGGTETYNSLQANNRYLAVQGEGIALFGAEAYSTALLRPSQLEAPIDTFNNIPPSISNTQSAARIWNEALLEAIRHDYARPTIHARNLFHTSVGMYDAWAAFENSASTYLLGKTVGNFTCPFDGVGPPTDKHQAQTTAISYAAYRLLVHRFQYSPNAATTLAELKKLFSILEYDDTYTSTDYSTGSAAALGNYIAAKIIEFGLQDGSNEQNGYANQFYQPVNPPFNPADPGDETLIDPNRWQPISLTVAIDQSGNPVESTPPFLSPEWGEVIPFALKEEDLNKYSRDGYEYWVYRDPGQFPLIDPNNGVGTSEEYMWNFSLVSIWSSHLDPTDGVMIDISPASVGNIPESSYPTTFDGFKSFYDLEQGGDPGQGYSVNPRTGLPYEPQLIPRGDYARVLAEFWADGPHSETPPGHWFTILNYVSDHPEFERKFNGQSEPIDVLEWDVKAYFTLGGALHDAAITAWGIKGYYDGIRPVSAIRSIAARGQSTDETLANYHPAGIPLRAGFVEIVQEGDPLAGDINENVGKIKLYAWRGPDYINDPNVDDAGVGWILADNWWPYQRPTFVSPPFAGYISGHSTYSRAGAYVLSWLTGDEYFPGGMSEFHAPMNEYLVFEQGPSVDVVLQWAKYKDASDQCSLSRIWGGIHPPFDDIPGRIIGKEIGVDACELAQKYFTGKIVTDVESVKNVSLQIYPNPIETNQRLRLKSALLQHDCRLRLTNATGTIEKELIVFGNESGEAEVDINNLKSGLYLIKLSNGRSTSISKLLVSN